MKITKILCTIMVFGQITSANAATQCEIKAYDNCDTYGIIGDTKGCSNYVHKCYYFNANAYRHLIDCTSCTSGYTLKTKHPSDNCSGTISYGVCESNGGSGDNYVSCTWVPCTDYGNPNEEKCVWNNREYEYRCKAGTYNMGKTEPTNCTWSCGTCPSGGTSDAGNNMGISSCYLTPGTYSDTTGTYKVTGNCYYKE